ncbi:linear amide C-N hydrolase [Ornithinibacillus sp. BX22]|uniref:Linear amide C-N hydrolase n=2 Tax=Ornithinibacillus TaxID=484508 RepID=A0A923L5B0_9BACI|nr:MULTISPECIES: C45 family peptidase [Ornithinibacillus]MBC5636763.1 linear amide C-N hydrolase [Ornithinibacillus hominis]MBS3681330.1 linear amide C-N hydrolase [Ornithinibacillus massiliensis]
MLPVYSDVIQFRGSHYDFGYYQGELLKDSPILENREKQWGSKRKYHFSIDEKEVQTAIKRLAPGIWDEIEGLADALKWNMHDAIREFGGYYLEYGRSGCSIFTGKDYLIRNYDNHPASYEGRYVFYQPTDQGYSMVGPSMQITGRIDGINEKGLAMGYNFVNRKKSGSGFICNMVGRIILEACATVEEAVDVLKAIPHRHSFSYVLLDQKGKTYVIEASPRRVDVHHGNACTNHFELLSGENRYRMDESVARQRAIMNQGENLINPYQAFQMMNDTDKGVFSTKYGAWAGTLHTAAYFPHELKAWFSLGGDQHPILFDFKKWLAGDKMMVRKVKGKLDVKTPFVNMAHFTEPEFLI